MRRPEQVLCALALDQALGDPSWLVHPVRLMGGLAGRIEGPCRRRLKNPKAAGVLAAGIIVSVSVLATYAFERGARRIHPILGEISTLYLLYSSVAARDLSDHALDVLADLEAGDLRGARRTVHRMVGRDVDSLDEAGITRAVVESVAENMVDGVTAPLFYAFLSGAPAAMGFKAVSTLDSTFGYRNKRYNEFGWASARLDDLANYVPARLTVPVSAIGARLLGMSAVALVRTVLRDGRKHASPNSGIAESAMAGALGVRLGGPLMRDGKPFFAPLMGQALRPLHPSQIRSATSLMRLTSLLFAAHVAAVSHLAGRRSGHL